jgi:hypothetical protein
MLALQQPPEMVGVCHLGCFERRLVHNRAETIDEFGGGHGIAMAGASAAIFTLDFGRACLGQFVAAWRVKPFRRFIVRMHVDCGMANILAGPGGEHYGMYDPANIGHLFSLAHAGFVAVRDELLLKHAATPEGLIEVVDIVYDEDGEPIGGKRLPHPDVLPPLDDSFYKQHGQHLRPQAA